MKKLLFITVIATQLFLGCKTKEVAPKPKAEFTFTTDAFGSATFKSLSTDAKDIYWEFGNGQTSTQPYVQHSYKVNKTYQVSLTAKGDGGSDVIVKSVNINTVTGSTMIYKAFNNSGVNIAVSIDGTLRGVINGSYTFTTSPDCGNNYSVTVEGLSEGSHTLSAKEVSGPNFYVWSGTVNIVGGLCSKRALTN